MPLGIIRLNHLGQIPNGIRLPGTKRYSNSVLGSEPRSVIQGFLTFPHSLYNAREKTSTSQLDKKYDKKYLKQAI